MCWADVPPTYQVIPAATNVILFMYSSYYYHVNNKPNLYLNECFNIVKLFLQLQIYMM